MTILSGQTIRRLGILQPFMEKCKDSLGNSAGLGGASYDLTVAEEINILPGEFMLASTRERFHLPNDVACIIHDKSSLIRQGLAVNNTFCDPGWSGYLTLELKNIGHENLHFPAGSAIAQAVFHWVDKPVEHPYDGKYQDQAAGPQKAR